jgi:L-asparaginase II
MKLHCNITRGGNIESCHQINALAIDEKGKILFSSGDPQQITCIRSSLKPFQAAAAIAVGAVDSAGFSDEEIALMCASHNGEEIHVQTAKNMAEKLGCTMQDYECGSHPPYDSNARNKARAEGFTPFHNNCSGKHSGMLAISKQLGVDTENYIEKDHPVQIEVFHRLKEFMGDREMQLGIDGCSAPTPFLSLMEIAQLFQKLGSGKYPELDRAYNAMASHSYLVGGNKRFDTDFNAAMKGRGITKVGGEAIRGMVIRSSKFGLVGIAQKVLDGNQRANEAAIMAVLNQLELLNSEEAEALQKHIKKPLYNHRKIHIGDVKAKLIF